MKKLYKNQKNSLYALSKKTGISLRNIYRYADKKIDIGKIPAWYVVKISNIENVEPNLLYQEIKNYLGGNK